MRKDLAYYRGLPYRLKVTRFVEEADGKAYYCAAFDELPQVKGVHEDRLLAIRLAKELFDAYVEAQLAWGEEIPEPESRRYRTPGGQGKIRLRHGSESRTALEHPLDPFPDETDPSEDAGARFIRQQWSTGAEASGKKAVPA